jgi:hypothetical protein
MHTTFNTAELEFCKTHRGLMSPVCHVSLVLMRLMSLMSRPLLK